MMNDKLILDLGFIVTCANYNTSAYKLPGMCWSSVWLHSNGSCEVAQKLYKYGNGNIITSDTELQYNSIYEAIPHIQNIVQQFKELNVVIKKEKIEEDFCN